MRAIDLQRLRHGLGWTQAQLAAHVGVSQPLVSAWERGARSPSEPVKKLLGVLVKQLQWEDEAPAPSRADMVGALLEQLAQQRAQDVDLSPLTAHTPQVKEGVETVVPTKQALTLGLFDAFQTVITQDLHDRASRLPATHPYPLLTAYLDQATQMLHDAPPASHQRSALIVALTSQPEVVGVLRAWYEDTIAHVLPQGHPEHDALSLILLGVDALWLFSLLGLTTFEESYALRMSEAARALMATLGVEA